MHGPAQLGRYSSNRAPRKCIKRGCGNIQQKCVRKRSGSIQLRLSGELSKEEGNERSNGTGNGRAEGEAGYGEGLCGTERNVGGGGDCECPTWSAAAGRAELQFALRGW